MAMITSNQWKSRVYTRKLVTLLFVGHEFKLYSYVQVKIPPGKVINSSIFAILRDKVTIAAFFFTGMYRNPKKK